ncbi:MAG: GIY-YIG nuclease family protein [Bacteroidota bacterium]
MFTVYVLYSEAHNRLYIGYTSDLITRFRFHNHLAKKGFTVRFRPWHVIHVEFFESKPAAAKREKQLKSGAGREWIRRTFLSQKSWQDSYPPKADGSSNLPLATLA